MVRCTTNPRDEAVRDRLRPRSADCLNNLCQNQDVPHAHGNQSGADPRGDGDDMNAEDDAKLNSTIANVMKRLLAEPSTHTTTLKTALIHSLGAQFRCRSISATWVGEDGPIHTRTHHRLRTMRKYTDRMQYADGPPNDARAKMPVCFQANSVESGTADHIVRPTPTPFHPSLMHRTTCQKTSCVDELVTEHTTLMLVLSESST